MQRKWYIFLLAILICLIVTGYNLWKLYGNYQSNVLLWKEETGTLFEKALLIELDKRGEIPVKIKSSGRAETSVLNESYPDTVVMAIGQKYYWFAIPKYKTENSLMKDMRRRTMQRILLEKYPISADTLIHVWDSLLIQKQIPFHVGVRCTYTDVEEKADTSFSPKNFFSLAMDSLTVKYMGARCEYEFAGYVMVPALSKVLAIDDWLVLIVPWILLGAIIRFRKVFLRKLVTEKVIEKEIHLADVPLEKAKLYKLPDGILFDTLDCSLRKEDSVHNISPQSVNLLKLFLRKDFHQISAEEIDKELWNGKGSNDQLRNAIYRLRKDLKSAGSVLTIQNINGAYELKTPHFIE